MIFIFIAVAALLAAVVLGSVFLADYVMTGKRQTEEEAFAWQSEHYDTGFYETAEKFNYKVTSFDGYVLNVQLLKSSTPTDKYVIISHGYTDNHIGSLKYAKMYLDSGFNTVIYDLRGHGENERTFTTYSIREGEDIAALVKDTKERYKDLTVLGLHGESLGAASTIASLKFKPEVDFAVADCGFADIESVLRLAYKNAHVPSFLVDFADFGAKIKYHYSIKKMRPIDSLKDNTVPILFIHGDCDTFITPENSERMYKAADGVKEIHIIKNAGHAESILINPDEYKNTVDEFIKSIIK